jgi:phage tail-like protein
MDVNGLPMWLFSGADGFGLDKAARATSAPQNVHWDQGYGYLRLASQQQQPNIVEDEGFARLMLSQPSPVCDTARTFAWWDDKATNIRASGFAEGATDINAPPEPGEVIVQPSDMALGDDQILLLARNGRVEMVDLRGRYPITKVVTQQFSADMLAPISGGGAWVFDRGRRKLGLLSGLPLRPAALLYRDPAEFQPKELNANPPKVRMLTDATIGASFEGVAIATSTNGQVALLAWETGADAAIFILEEERLKLLGRTKGIKFPWSLSWQGENRIAVLASDGKKPAQQAFLYPVDEIQIPGGDMLPTGKLHFLKNAWPVGFCNGLDESALYLAIPAKPQPELADPPELVRRLIALAGDSYAGQGEVLIGPIDAGADGTVWHRLYCDASVRGACGMTLSFFASDQRLAPVAPAKPKAANWAPHRLGNMPYDDAPITKGAWCDADSEIAGAKSLLTCPAVPDQSGLFTVLLQAADSKVRRITGRYGWIHVKLEGDGRDTPELAAIRIYAGRLSYRDAYLPDFYSESLSGDDACQIGAATPPDFLERYLALFEGPFTEIEGRIAGSWRLTDPATAPGEALPWIASWIGVDDDSSGDLGRMRQSLMAAPHQNRLRGTCGGLLSALEIATGGRVITGGTVDADNPPDRIGRLVIARVADRAIRALLIGTDINGQCVILTGGAVTRGEIVVVEGFRLRRTFATILGADLADEDDPLTLGLAVSGNSFVGDTLMLGEQARPELAALYRADMDFAVDDQAAVRAFFAKLAHRVLILVRNGRDRSELQRLADLAAEHVPAHVEPQLFTANASLIVGAASLVGVDTFLMNEPAVERVRLNRSIIGSGDQIRNEGWLDNRADGPTQRSPRARADGPATVWRGAPFVLSALSSRARDGRDVSQYIWTWEQP